MLLSGKGGACHDEDALLVVGLLALRLIDTAHRGQGEGVAQRAPCAARDGVGVVRLAGIVEVGVGGIG